MAAPKIYRFDDADAPVLTASDKTKLIALLKACLVDGYGTKPAAGWTMPYINNDNDIAAFRNNPATGTGFYMQVQAGGYANETKIVGYESMTDETTGVNPFGNNSSFIHSTTQNSTARPWILFADDRFFHLFVWNDDTLNSFNTSQNCMKHICFGDGIPLSQSDSYFCVRFVSTSGINEQPHSLYASNQSATGGSGQYVARNIAGDLQANRQCALVHGGGPREEGAWYRDNNALPRTLGSEVLSRPYVNDSTAYSFRGYIPGIWFPCHPARDFNNLEQLEIGAHRFVVCRSYYSTLRNTLAAIDISEHWRP